MLKHLLGPQSGAVPSEIRISTQTGQQTVSQKPGDPTITVKPHSDMINITGEGGE